MKAKTPPEGANARAGQPGDDLVFTAELTAPLAANTLPADLLLTEDGAIALLQQSELATSVLEQLVRNANLLKSRKVKVALVAHPRTPRHISLPLLRQLYTFDLMQIALTPAVAGDLKRAADGALCNRLTTISSGERLALARTH